MHLTCNAIPKMREGSGKLEAGKPETERSRRRMPEGGRQKGKFKTYNLGPK